jgi:hypothetical protein
MDGKGNAEFDEGEKRASKTGSVLALGPRPRRQPALGKHKEAIEGSATDLSRDRVSLRLDLSFGSIVVMQETVRLKC